MKTNDESITKPQTVQQIALGMMAVVAVLVLIYYGFQFGVWLKN